MWSLTNYLRKRREMNAWKAQKKEKWLDEGVSLEEIKRRLKGHKISLKDGKRKQKSLA